MRDAGCTRCKLSRRAEGAICRWGVGPAGATIMVVGRMPNSAKFQAQLEEELVEIGLGDELIYFASAVKCLNFDQSASNGDVKSCRPYLEKEIASVRPKFILALGNEALLSVLGKSGITKYRGRPYEAHGAIVVPTISPSAVARNPRERPGFQADLRLFMRLVKGKTDQIAKPKYTIIDTRAKLDKLKRDVLPNVLEMDVDVETHDEWWRPGARIVSMAATCVVRRDDGTLGQFVFAIPLYHPESVWRKKWRAVLLHIRDELVAIPQIVAHNGKYDEKWFRRFGVPLTVTFDTILALHLLNENQIKKLKVVGPARLGVEPWGVDTKTLLTMPIEEVLEYNVLDTFYMRLIKKQVAKELKERPRLYRLFRHLMMPGNADLVHSEMIGIYLDVKRLDERRPSVAGELARIEEAIASHLPPTDDPRWPTDARGRPLKPNYNASNFARWMLFEYLGLPVIERGKEKDDGGQGAPSMREGVLMELRSRHEVVELMLERVKWQKYLTSFINAYAEMFDEDHRVHTNFKLIGTVTGRLSSGKTDDDKITGVRGKTRGVNLQQVPRDKLIRGLFGAAPGWTFVEADYSQIELRIAAFIAREENMLHLYNVGADIHMSTAMEVTGLPKDKVTSEIRKKVGKPVNFGFLYGMSWRKFITTAFENYGSHFNESEARGARERYFRAYPGLVAWHARQKSLVNKYGKVESPLGRVRHLPDIYSPDQGVRAEAERQAINSPVQGFASDMALFAMTIINRKFRERGIAGRCIGLVHDAINFEIRNDHMHLALPIIKDTMEDVAALRRTFGVVLDVPIVADLKAGQHWGDSVELSDDDVYDWKAAS
jgi:uracil-DNA glycosylase family 4